MDRRGFLKTTGVAVVGVSAIRTLSGATQGVSIIVDPKIRLLLRYLTTLATSRFNRFNLQT